MVGGATWKQVLSGTEIGDNPKSLRFQTQEASIMGRNRLGTLPKITVHPRSGHARVRYNGREIWLGKNGSEEAQQKTRNTVPYVSSQLLS